MDVQLKSHLFTKKGLQDEDYWGSGLYLSLLLRVKPVKARLHLTIADSFYKIKAQKYTFFLKCSRLKNGCNRTNRPVPDSTARGFIYLCLGGKWLHGRLSVCETHEDGWATGRRVDGPRHRHTSASVRIPQPGRSVAVYRWLQPRGQRRITSEILIHTEHQFAAMAASKRICSFDAERRVHLLLIRPDRFTSASPRSRRAAHFLPALSTLRVGVETARAAFRFLQQVDGEAAGGGTF